MSKTLRTLPLFLLFLSIPFAQSVFATEGNAFTDLGAAPPVTISTAKVADIASASLASAQVITRADIDTWRYESVADAVSHSVTGVINSNGSLGALQNANVNGMGAGRTYVYINGILASTSYDNNFDLNLVPISAVEKIEILSSGAGKTGRNVAAGGVINIETRASLGGEQSKEKIEDAPAGGASGAEPRIEGSLSSTGAFTETNPTPEAEKSLSGSTSPSSVPHFQVSFENGSFMPAEEGFMALLDSQDLHFTYSNEFVEAETSTGSGGKAGNQRAKGKHSILVSAGGMRAGNKYSYKAEDFGVNKWTLRENAGTWAADIAASAVGEFEAVKYSSMNLARYVHSEVPGGYTDWGASLTPKNWQNSLLFSSANTVSIHGVNLKLGYTYVPVLVYHDESAGTEDSHFKHAITASADTTLSPAPWLSLSPFAEVSVDIAKSTSLDETQTRFAPKTGLGAVASFGRMAIYPMASLVYVSDIERLFPDASLGLEFAAGGGFTLNTSLTYAHRLPTFSDLYWPFIDYGWGFTYKGNPDLKPEKALSGTVGAEYEKDLDSLKLNIGGYFFTRWINDQILTAPDYSTMQNLDNAIYLGTNLEAKITWRAFKAEAGYLFNKSYNLTGGLSVSDDVRVSGVRMHTSSLALSYSMKNTTLFTEMKYLGKYWDASEREFDGAFVWNAGASWKPNRNLDLYLKVENLLNSQYQLLWGYPMPPLKIRLGGTWCF